MNDGTKPVRGSIMIVSSAFASLVIESMRDLSAAVQPVVVIDGDTKFERKLPDFCPDVFPRLEKREPQRDWLQRSRKKRR